MSSGFIGYHSQHAGELSAAADWYLLWGKHSLLQGALREAKDFFTQALELLPPVDYERRWQALLGCEDVLTIIRDYDPWKATISALLELANSFDDENYLAEAYLRQAGFGLTADVHLVLQASQEALKVARRCGNEAIEIQALSTISVIDLNRGDKQAAIEKIENI